MSFEKFNFENSKEKQWNSSEKKSIENMEKGFIKIANDAKEKIEALGLKDPSLLKHYITVAQKAYSYFEDLKDPNNYSENWEMKEELKRKIYAITNPNQVDRIKYPNLKMPENFDWTNEEWHSLPKEIKEHIINWGTEVFLEPWDVISWGLMSIYVWLEKIIWKGVLLVIKESWKAFLKWASEEIIPIDLIKDWKEILELLKKKWIHLIESWKNIIKDVFSNGEMVTPEWIKINEKSFDNSENSFKMSKKEIGFEEALEKFVIPKDIENMSVKEFWRTLQEWIHQNLIQAPIWKMIEERRDRFFQKHIEAMEWILKWVEKHPEEAKTTFKDKLKDYFLDVKREWDLYKISNTNKDKIKLNLVILDKAIKIFY